MTHTEATNAPLEALNPNVFREIHEQLEISEQAAHILDVAMSLFAQKGYAATSVREIVQTAHVTNPMLYYYFDSKEGVFHTLIDLLLGSLQQNTTTIFEGSLRGFGWEVEEFFRMHFEGMRTTPLSFRFIYSVLLGPKDGRPQVNLFEKRQGVLDMILQRFDQAVEDGEFTPHRGLSTSFLVDRLMGHLNQWAMQTLKMIDAGKTGGLTAQEWLHQSTDQNTLEQHMRFYFFGAGTLHKGPAYLREEI